MLSLLAVPGLLSAPDSAQALAQQWEGIFNRGMVLCPLTAVLSALGYGYLARAAAAAAGGGQRSSGRFVGAAALTFAIMPFTVLVMNPTNQALQRAAAARGGESQVGEVQAVRERLRRWSTLNLVRSLLPLASAVLGFWTLVEEWA